MPKRKSDDSGVVDPVDSVDTPDDVDFVGTPSVKSEHGAQSHLTGAARAAARGGLHGDIVSNTIARDAAFERGEAADGLTPDGTTRDGRQPPDVVDGDDQAVFGPADESK